MKLNALISTSSHNTHKGVKWINSLTTMGETLLKINNTSFTIQEKYPQYMKH